MTDLFKVEPSIAPEQPKVISLTCGTCKHFRPYRDPHTKRIRNTEAGWCSWQMPEFSIPMSVERVGLGAISITRTPVWKNTDASKCKCWEAK